MAYFPFMILLDDKPALVVGGGRVGCRKALQLLDFGARVTVVAPFICDELAHIAQNDDRLCIIQRGVVEADIYDKEVVILATNDSELNSRFAALCKKNRILVNVVDVKKDCGFYFPAIIRQGEVVISVSTGGASPLLAAKIKQDINSSIRNDYGDIACELNKIREYALTNINSEEERRAYFERELDKRLE